MVHKIASANLLLRAVMTASACRSQELLCGQGAQAFAKLPAEPADPEPEPELLSGARVLVPWRGKGKFRGAVSEQRRRRHGSDQVGALSLSFPCVSFCSRDGWEPPAVLPVSRHGETDEPKRLLPHRSSKSSLTTVISRSTHARKYSPGSAPTPKPLRGTAAGKMR